MPTRTANPHIHKLLSNTRGKDYVCGDIHGSFEPFLKLLGKVRFNPEQDRVICTGDLTHKGPDSAGCLELLGKPWFHCVRGNHEENTLRALNIHFGNPDTGQDAYYQLAKEGGIWLCELVAATFAGNQEAARINHLLAATLDHIQNLPKIIVVGEKENRYHVAHAGLIKNEKLDPEDKRYQEKCLFQDVEIDAICEGLTQIEKPYLLNESHDLGEAARSGRLKESEGTPTFCGHTSLPEVAQVYNHIHIDTGAGKPDRTKKQRMLTFIETQSGEIFQEPAGHPEREVHLRSYVKELERAVAKKKPIPLPEISDTPF